MRRNENKKKTERLQTIKTTIKWGLVQRVLVQQTRRLTVELLSRTHSRKLENTKKRSSWSVLMVTWGTWRARHLSKEPSFLAPLSSIESMEFFLIKLWYMAWYCSLRRQSLWHITTTIVLYLILRSWPSICSSWIWRIQTSKRWRPDIHKVRRFIKLRTFKRSWMARWLSTMRCVEALQKRRDSAGCIWARSSWPLTTTTKSTTQTTYATSQEELHWSMILRSTSQTTSTEQKRMLEIRTRLVLTNEKCSLKHNNITKWRKMMLLMLLTNGMHSSIGRQIRKQQQGSLSITDKQASTVNRESRIWSAASMDSSSITQFIQTLPSSTRRSRAASSGRSSRDSSWRSEGSLEWGWTLLKLEACGKASQTPTSSRSSSLGPSTIWFIWYFWLYL